jgi:hypothetical protein
MIGHTHRAKGAQEPLQGTSQASQMATGPLVYSMLKPGTYDAGVSGGNSVAPGGSNPRGLLKCGGRRGGSLKGGVLGDSLSVMGYKVTR